MPQNIKIHSLFHIQIERGGEKERVMEQKVVMFQKTHAKDALTSAEHQHQMHTSNSWNCAVTGKPITKIPKRKKQQHKYTALERYMYVYAL